jgi:hypothetical protein
MQLFQALIPTSIGTIRVVREAHNASHFRHLAIVRAT